MFSYLIALFHTMVLYLTSMIVLSFVINAILKVLGLLSYGL